MSNFFINPFANEGDRTKVPSIEGPDKGVSYQKGFSELYSLAITQGSEGKALQRKNFNDLFYSITNSIRELQLGGIRDYDSIISNNGGYPAGAICLIQVDHLTNVLVNPANNETYSSIYKMKVPVMSLVDDNSNSGPFIKISEDKFKTADARGHYLRNTGGTSTDVGKLQVSKPPNIRGKFLSSQNGMELGLQAFYIDTQVEDQAPLPSAYNNNTSMIGFDASLYNTIYDDSIDEVQPLNLSTRMLIKVP